MSGVNKVILIGNLGKDPESHTFPNGNKIAKFTLATSESYKDKNTGEKVDNVEWHNISVFGKTVDFVLQYLKKGSPVFVEGNIKTRSWEDNGVKKYMTEIATNIVTSIGGKPQAGNSAENQAAASADSYMVDKKQASATPAPSAPAPSAQPAVVSGGDFADTDDDLPF